MARTRRIFILLFLALMAAPGLLTIASEVRVRTGGRPLYAGLEERRVLAAFPGRPGTTDEAISWLSRLDLYLTDNFGLRRPLIELSNASRFALFKVTPDERTGLGPTGRLFLNSHSREALPYSAIHEACGYGITDQVIDGAVRNIELTIADALKINPRSWLIIVPSAPALNADELPEWLQRQCSGVPVGHRMASRIGTGNVTSDQVFYAWEPMVEANTLPLGAFPPHGFHWEGEGPRLTVAAFASRANLPTATLPLHPMVTPRASDIASFMPGIDLRSFRMAPDLKAIGGKLCRGRGCFGPEMKPIAQVLRDTTRLTSPAAPPRKLLFLTDSFGRAAVPWLAVNYRQVWHFSLNYHARLSEPQKAEFLRQIFDVYQPDDVVFLVHDAAAFFWPSMVDSSILHPLLQASGQLPS